MVLDYPTRIVYSLLVRCKSLARSLRIKCNINEIGKFYAAITKLRKQQERNRNTGFFATKIYYQKRKPNMTKLADWFNLGHMATNTISNERNE